MQNNIKSTDKTTALYARFSRNDSDNESDSIAHQRKILQDYAVKNGFSDTKFYADDGISGTTFDRPDFTRLLEDIEKGEIGTVIVKDLSRLGRLNAMVSYYIDLYFPKNMIRFIAVYDDVDSEKGDNEFAPFKNIFNEWYARDTSKKIRAVLKNKGMNGGILCSKPIYGYKIDIDNKNHWLIDDEAAEVVRLIYNLYTEEGLGITRITNTLRDHRIITPTEYFRQKGLTVRERRQKEVYYWSICTVREILHNQFYTGDVINFKTYRKSYKDHKMYWNDPEDCVVFKGVNDPIISENQYLKAQEIIEKNRRMPTVREPDMFQGYVYCADCGKRLSLNHGLNCTVTPAYVCNTYRRNSMACTSHYVRREAIEAVTLREVKRLIYASKHNPTAFENNLRLKMKVSNEKDLKAFKRDLEKLQMRSAELDKIMSQLYEDKALEKISEERYFLVAREFENQQKEVREKIEVLKKAMYSAKQNTDVIDKFIETIKKYDDVAELNQYVLLDLVDKIIIRQREEGQDYEDMVNVQFKEIGNIFFDVEVH